MTERTVYDLGRYFAVVGSQGRISGKWCVTRNPHGRMRVVTPIDCVVDDEDRRSGMAFYAGAFTATVRDGVAEIGNISGSAKYDLESVRELLRDVVVAVAAAAEFKPIEGTETDRV